MEVPGTVLFISSTYLVMLAGYYLHRVRLIHLVIMPTILVIDCLFPVYLFMTNDWWKRLIIEGEILSFMLWMHLILVLTLYMFYWMQVSTAVKILKEERGVGRDDHRRQALGILIVRALVIMTGTLFAK